MHPPAGTFGVPAAKSLSVCEVCLTCHFLQRNNLPVPGNYQTLDYTQMTVGDSHWSRLPSHNQKDSIADPLGIMESMICEHRQACLSPQEITLTDQTVLT